MLALASAAAPTLSSASLADLNSRARSDPLAVEPFYLQDDTYAAQAAAAYRAAGDREDARLLMRIASRPQAIWLNGSVYDPETVTETMYSARRQKRLPVFVLYDLFFGACVTHRGVVTPPLSPRRFRSWAAQIAARLGSSPAAVIVEPDALAAANCRTPAQQMLVYSLLRYVDALLARRPRTAVYIDAGNVAWQPVSVMVQRLRLVGISDIWGFALNVANFPTTSASIAYGERISRAVGGAHFVIDTGRNGRGPLWRDGTWRVCNPPGRGLGIAPTTHTASPLVDAYLWIKPPGESDGACNGAPATGLFWPSYALGLALNAKPA
jgi:endoglucanase